MINNGLFFLHSDRFWKLKRAVCEYKLELVGRISLISEAGRFQRGGIIVIPSACTAQDAKKDR